jgi:hypothetical protein
MATASVAVAIIHFYRSGALSYWVVAPIPVACFALADMLGDGLK